MQNKLKTDYAYKLRVQDFATGKIFSFNQYSKQESFAFFVSGLHNCLEFSQPPLVFISGYANTENAFYCLNNIIKAINAAVNYLKFYYCNARSKQYASVSTWLCIFFTSQLFFFLETEKKFTQVAYDNYKKIVKSILRCRKTINSPKNYFWERQICKEWSAHAIAGTVRGDDKNNTHLFSLLSVNKLERFSFKLPYKRW